MFKIRSRDALEVYVSTKGYVCIKQESPLGDDPNVVALEPVLAKQVGQWLMKLADDAALEFSLIDADDNGSVIERKQTRN